jgi:hypothetical protein
MFKTAEPFACQQKIFKSMFLVMIIFCLSAHFLLEDIFLFGQTDAASQCCFTAEPSFDEIEHQDDLLMAARPSESQPRNHPPVIQALSFHLERQFAFPIRIPPKIV